MVKFDKTKPHAFIDGSYNEKTNYYGWGKLAASYDVEKI